MNRLFKEILESGYLYTIENDSNSDFTFINIHDATSLSYTILEEAVASNLFSAVVIRNNRLSLRFLKEK